MHSLRQAIGLELENLKHIPKESFFDMNYQGQQKFWTILNEEDNYEQINSFGDYIGTFELLKLSKEDQLVSRFFTLYKNALIHSKNKDRGPYKYTMLTDARMIILDKPEIHDNFFVKLTKKSQYQIITSKNYEVIEVFILLLQKLCVLHNFTKKYEIIKLIGKGGNAKVYLAKSKQGDQQFAAKVFKKKKLIGQEKAVESITNEISIMRQLNHPNIMSLFEVYETIDNIIFIVELVKGVTLLEKVESLGCFDEEESYIIMGKLLLAIDFMHQNGIMHRDLKLSNILLSQNNVNNIINVKLADFGLSTKINVEEYVFYRCGTPGYIAPEIMTAKKGKLYTEKCDIFSLGVIFFILLTGNPPFQGSSFNDVVQKNKNCKVDYEMLEIQLISEETIDLIKAMLQKNPLKRPSAAEILQQEQFFKTAAKILEISDINSMIEDKSPQNNIDREKFGDFLLPSRMSEIGSEFIQCYPILNGRTNTMQESTPFASKNFTASDMQSRSQTKMDFGNMTLPNDKRVNKLENPSATNSLVNFRSKLTFQSKEFNLVKIAYKNPQEKQENSPGTNSNKIKLDIGSTDLKNDQLKIINSTFRFPTFRKEQCNIQTEILDDQIEPLSQKMKNMYHYISSIKRPLQNNQIICPYIQVFY